MSWQTHAACRDTDPELFFPPSTTSPTHRAVRRSSLAVAPVCGRCPVATECLRWALDTGQDHGMWAATTPTERRAIRRARLAGVPDPVADAEPDVPGLLAAVPLPAVDGELCAACRQERGACHARPRAHPPASSTAPGAPRGPGASTGSSAGCARGAPSASYEASVVAFANALRGRVPRGVHRDLRLCQYVSVAAGVTVRTPRVGEVRARPADLVHRRADARPGARRLHQPRRTGPASRTPSAPTACGSSRSPGAGCGCICSTPTRCATASGSRRSPSPPGAESVILGRTEDGITLGHAITDAGAPRRCRA